MSKSPTITSNDWLPNDHAGQLLASEFLEPLDMSPHDLARAIGTPTDRVKAMIAGHEPVDGEIDLRLTRYFNLSEGFFLRLQNQYDLLEAKRRLSDALDRIVPRAA